MPIPFGYKFILVILEFSINMGCYNFRFNLETSISSNWTCINTEQIASISIKSDQGSYKELWNIKTAKNKLETLSMLFINVPDIPNSNPSIKLTLRDGKVIESNHVDDDFSVNGAGILYLRLEDDELLLTNIAENVTLHGQFVNGCLDGFVFGVAQWWKFPTELDSEDNEKEYIDDNPMYKVLNFVGQYKLGKLFGPIWKPVYSLDEVPIGYYYSDVSEYKYDTSNKDHTNEVFGLR